MYITFKTKKLQKQCCEKAITNYGTKIARLISRRLQEIEAADNFNILLEYKIGKCHSLKGNLQGKYGIWLDNPFRMIIEPIYEKEDCECQGACTCSMDLSKIKIVDIVDIGDYHGKKKK